MSAMPYIPEKSIMVASLNNELTTIKHDLDDEVVLGVLPENLQENGLDVYYTIPCGTENPVVADINGVYVHNHANVIVGQRTNLKGLDRLGVVAAIDSIVNDLLTDNHIWCVEIEGSARSGKPHNEIKVKSTYSLEIKGGHLMTAIHNAFEQMVESGIFEVNYNDFDFIDGVIDRCASKGEPIVFNDNGANYTLISIKKLEK